LQSHTVVSFAAKAEGAARQPSAAASPTTIHALGRICARRYIA
jgi:hypothetical protein